MKSCYRCGKVVANSEVRCPKCGSWTFNTEEKRMEGIGIELMFAIHKRNPVVFWIIVGLLVGGMILWINLA